MAFARLIRIYARNVTVVKSDESEFFYDWIFIEKYCDKYVEQLIGLFARGVNNETELS